MSMLLLIVTSICVGAIPTAFFFEGRIQRIREEMEEERRIRGRVDER